MMGNRRNVSRAAGAGRRGRFFAFAAALTLLTGASALPAAADTAVVVGVSRYPNLPPEVQLGGPANDARSIADVLKQNRFRTITLLTDAEATKVNILKAIGDAAKATGANERFVFFFAGHGSDAPQSILPCDARLGSSATENKTVITRAELQKAVGAVGAASSRTIILDACFSGGMRDADGRMTELGNGRYVNLVQGGKGVPPDPNDSDLMTEDDAAVSDAAAKPAPLRILAAAKKNQKAYEYPYKNGPKQGVFTHNLLPYLAPAATNNTASPALSTAEIIAKVAQGVEKDTYRHQSPTPSKIEDSEPLLGPTTAASTAPSGSSGHPAPVASGAAPVAVKDISVWDTFYVERPNPEFVSVTVSPRKTDFAVQEDFSPAIVAKREGYVLLLDKDAEGKISLLFPSTNSIEQCHLLPGENRSLGVLFLEKPGMDTMKAVHFTDRALAQQWLHYFFPEKGAKAGARLPADFRFFTSQFTLQSIATGAAASSAPTQREEKTAR